MVSDEVLPPWVCKRVGDVDVHSAHRYAGRTLSVRVSRRILFERDHLHAPGTGGRQCSSRTCCCVLWSGVRKPTRAK
jgi:hypothetical protein